MRKTQLCKYFAKGFCKYLTNCKYAHGVSELRRRIRPKPIESVKPQKVHSNQVHSNQVHSTQVIEQVLRDLRMYQRCLKYGFKGKKPTKNVEPQEVHSNQVIEQVTRDLRTNRRCLKYGFKGNTIRRSSTRPHINAHSLIPTPCKNCKGVCILSDFIDDHKKRLKRQHDDPTEYQQKLTNYEQMFNPKYHRTLINYLQQNGFYDFKEIRQDKEEDGEDYEDYEDEEELKKYQSGDPESWKYLSQRQKARVRRQLQFKEDQLFNDEWSRWNQHTEEKAFRIALERFKSRDYQSTTDPSEALDLEIHDAKYWSRKHRQNLAVALDKKKGSSEKRPKKYSHNQDNRDKKKHLMEFQLDELGFIKDEFQVLGSDDEYLASCA